MFNYNDIVNYTMMSKTIKYQKKNFERIIIIFHFLSVVQNEPWDVIIGASRSLPARSGDSLWAVEAPGVYNNISGLSGARGFSIILYILLISRKDKTTVEHYRGCNFILELVASVTPIGGAYNCAIILSTCRRVVQVVTFWRNNSEILLVLLCVRMCCMNDRQERKLNFFINNVILLFRKKRNHAKI